MKSPHCGHCPITGKAQYTTKKIAKTAVKRYAGKQKAYRCDEVCGMWHVGTPPTAGESRERMRQWRERKAKEYHGWSDYREGSP